MTAAVYVPHAARILVVDDDSVFRLSTAELLRADGHVVEEAANGQEAVQMLRASRFDLMLLDLRMPGTDGLTLVEALRLWGDGIPILMISGFGTVDVAVSALHLGADDFITKPVEPGLLSARVSALLERRPMRERVADAPGGLVGRAPLILALFDAMRRVAPTDATVLITGETGTGKELVARAVHEQSARRNRPFVPVNCAALAEGLLESELFGHVRGAFTGAVRDKSGLFEAADGGTIFLDEIGAISAGLQQRLLRVLQEREVQRVGAVRATPVDVRIIAATNSDLRALVAAGRFREDLFYRLNVFPLVVPPLRERMGDVPLLVLHALDNLRAREGWSELACSALAMRLFRAHTWPGNVRELLSAVESAAIRAGGGRIDAQHLPPEVRDASAGDLGELSRYRAPDTSDEERTAILSALEHTGGALGRTAEMLGMGRTTLWRKLKELGIRE